MSIQNEIERINQNISNSYSAVQEKGGTVPQAQNSANLAAAINSIPEGGDTTYLINAPIGAILIWSGTEDSVPQGWSICNGENGTLDLRDKFVLGAGTGHSVGETGGAEEVTLTVAQIPGHQHGYSGYVGTNSASLNSGTTKVLVGSASLKTLEAGSSEPHPNMPPYYTALYIQKTGVTPSDYSTEERVHEIVDVAINGAIEEAY